MQNNNLKTFQNKKTKKKKQQQKNKKNNKKQKTTVKKKQKKKKKTTKNEAAQFIIALAKLQQNPEVIHFYLFWHYSNFISKIMFFFYFKFCWLS